MEEAEEPQKACQVCQTIPENIICLSCNHTVCLVCAANVVIENRQPVGYILLQGDLQEIECPLCKERTKISEEVRDALVELFEDHQFYGQGEEEADLEQAEEIDESSNQVVGESQNEVALQKDTSNGEEEYAEEEHTENVSRTQLSNTRIDTQLQESRQLLMKRKSNPQAKRKQGSQPNSKPGQELDYLLTFPCREHPDDYCTHFSPILKNLICPQCVVRLEERRIDHNSKPIRKCTA